MRMSRRISIVRLRSLCACVVAGLLTCLGLAQPLPLRGADISSLPEDEFYGAAYKSSAGVPTDLVSLIKARGGNLVRIRLWNSPTLDSNGNADPVGQHFCDIAHTIALAKRAKAAGLKVLLDFHYSDYWADPGHQNKPAAWSSLSLADLEKAIYTFTKVSVQQMVEAGVSPDYVATGNEISNGFLWPTGQLGGGDNSWAQFSALLKQAIQGVRDAAPNAKVMIHIDRGGDNAGAQNFYDNLAANGVSFDIIGLSYYPWWQGKLSALKDNLTKLEARYGKPILVTETGYPATLVKVPNSSGVFLDGTNLVPGMPPSPEGQTSFIRSAVDIVRKVPNGHGLGLIWWEPAWVSTKTYHTGWDFLDLFDPNSVERPGLTELLTQPGPSTVRNAQVYDDVFYQIMPIAWRNADGQNGTYKVRFGDFDGMTASLDYLQSLGATAIWMTPIFPSDAYHGYQHGDGSKLNPWFGTQNQWMTFVRAAHAKGIKVFIDLVAYGISTKTPWFQNSYQNPTSVFTPYIDYLDPQNKTYGGYSYPTWDGNTIGFAYWNLESTGAQNLVNSWCQKWLDPLGNRSLDAGVDGFRLDSVWPNGNYGPGYTTQNFWIRWKSAIAAVNPKAFVFAEQGDWGIGDNTIPPMDGAFTIPLMFGVRGGLNAGDAGSIYAIAAQTWALSPPRTGKAFLGILGNHDNDRLTSVLGSVGGKLRLAADIQLTLPFPPCIYFGDELGMLGFKSNAFNSDANDIPNREPFKWNAVDSAPMSEYYKLNSGAYTARYSHNNDGRSVQEQTGVAGTPLETYRELIRLRKQEPALRGGIYEPLLTDTSNVYAYVRRVGTDCIIVANNLASTPKVVSINLSSYQVLATTTPPIDLVSGAVLPAITAANQGGYRLSLSGYQSAMLKVALGRVDQPTQIDGWLPASDNLKFKQLALQTQPTTYVGAVGALDRLVGRIDPDGLYLGITGNIPTTADSSLVVLIDDGKPGQNVLKTTGLVSPPPGIEGLNGLKLDAGFTPSRAIFVNSLNGNYYVDALVLPASSAASKTYLGQGTTNWGTDALSFGSNTMGALVSLNNTNTAGVTTTSAAGAANPRTGLEMKLPYALLGSSSTVASFKVAAFLVRSGGIVTNQWLPAATGSLKDLGSAPDMTKIPGNQFAVLTR